MFLLLLGRYVSAPSRDKKLGVIIQKALQIWVKHFCEQHANEKPHSQFVCI